MTLGMALGMTPGATADWTQRRRSVVRAALGVGVATGAYGVSFGALAVAAGLSVPQACALSVLMFTGGSQFALVGVLGGGGGAVSASATALLLGARNALYAVRLATLLGVRGGRRLVGAQLVIDESTAVALGQEERRASQLGFWATGLAVFVLWNLATLIGAFAGEAMGDPRAFGLDAAAPAALLGLLAPRLRSREAWAVAAVALVIALILVPGVPAGVPVLVAGLVAVAAGLRGRDE
jgi:predicted branched-subunit amino acid permease